MADGSSGVAGEVLVNVP